MTLPILLDDLICFAIAVAIATLCSFVGTWMAHETRDRRPILQELYLSIVTWMTRSTREHRLFQFPGWQPTRNGALVAAAILYVSGVGALWRGGDDTVNFGLFGAMFLNDRKINQGLIGLAWTAILVFWWVAAVCAIAWLVAFMTVRLRRPAPLGVWAGRFSLRTFFIVCLIVSVAIVLWITARQQSIRYQRALNASITAWRPYGLEPIVSRSGEVWALDRTPGKPAMKLSEKVFQDAADLPRLETLDLSDLAIPKHAFKTLLDAPRLHLLYLSGSDITDQQLQDIAKLRVSLMFLEDTGISDAGLRNLAPLMQKQVRESKNPGVTIHVHNTQVTQAGIVELKTSGMVIGGTWHVDTQSRRKKSLR